VAYRQLEAAIRYVVAPSSGRRRLGSENLGILIARVVLYMHV
jgi:hypothetical protein